MDSHQLRLQPQQRKQLRKMTKPGPAPTWPLPHGEGQGPRPSQKLPPLKKAKGKIKGKYGKAFKSAIA